MSDFIDGATNEENTCIQGILNKLARLRENGTGNQVRLATIEYLAAREVVSTRIGGNDSAKFYRETREAYEAADWGD